MDDYRQTDEYCAYFCKHGWTQEKIGSTRILLKKTKGFGLLIKVHRGCSDTSFDELNKFAKAHKASVVIYESSIANTNPEYINYIEQLKRAGYKDSNVYLSPTKTVHIDLQNSTERILSNFNRSLKRSIRNNKSKNISYVNFSSLDGFYTFLSEVARKNKVYTQSLTDWKDKWEPFGEKIKIILAYVDNVIIGGNMFLIHNNGAYGLFLPITDLGKRYDIAASLIWESLKQAKSLGCTRFDLNGLYDERYGIPRRWQGFSNFKRHFNGETVEYLRPQVKVYSWVLQPLQYFGLLWIFFIEN